MSVAAYHFALCSSPVLSLHQHRNENFKYEVSSWKNEQTTYVQSNTMKAHLIKYIILTYMLHFSACT